ncbi:MAG: type II secretion system F family protein, partial [Actinomycetota bacterium]
MSPAALSGLLAAMTVAASIAAIGTASSPDLFPAMDGSPSSEPGDAHRRVGRRERRARAAEVERQVPQLLDLLAAGSSAGLSAELSLRRSAASLPGALGDDLRSLFERADLGSRWRDDFAAYAASSGSSDLRRTVAVLERTEVLGSSLVDATRELAVSVRQARRASTLERARTAPVKMLFPLVFLILPAFLLLTVV